MMKSTLKTKIFPSFWSTAWPSLRMVRRFRWGASNLLTTLLLALPLLVACKSKSNLAVTRNEGVSILTNGTWSLKDTLFVTPANENCDKVPIALGSQQHTAAAAPQQRSGQPAIVTVRHAQLDYSGEQQAQSQITENKETTKDNSFQLTTDTCLIMLFMGLLTLVIAIITVKLLCR